MPLPKSWTTVTPLSKSIAMILFILLPFIGFSAGIRYQQKIHGLEQNKKQVVMTPSPTPSTQTNIYTDSVNGYKFTYPSILEVTTQTPDGFEFVPQEDQFFLKTSGKMFANCDLYLKFKGKYSHSLIAVDILEPNSSIYCWSNGYFKKDSTRNISYHPSQTEIERSKWRYPHGEFGNEKIWADNWERDYFQSITVEVDEKTIAFGLMNQQGYRDETEQILDEIVKSVSRSKNEQTLCTQEAKQCSDGVWVGRTGPNCQFICPKK